MKWKLAKVAYWSVFLADFSLLNYKVNFLAIYWASQNQHRLVQPQNSSSRPLHSQRHAADGRVLTAEQPPQKKQEATSTSEKNVSSEQQQKIHLEKKPGNNGLLLRLVDGKVSWGNVPCVVMILSVELSVNIYTLALSNNPAQLHCRKEGGEKML